MTETVVFWFVEYVLHLLCITQNYKVMIIMMMTEEAASGTRKVFSTQIICERKKEQVFVTEIVLFGVWHVWVPFYLIKDMDWVCLNLSEFWHTLSANISSFRRPHAKSICSANLLCKSGFIWEDCSIHSSYNILQVV